MAEKEKGLRQQVFELLGPDNQSKEAQAMYLIIGRVEELEGKTHSLDDRTSGLRTYGGPRNR